MRLVRLTDLSDEERRKALEEQQERLNKNRQELQNVQNKANQNFDNYISQHGAYDTNKHTTTIGDLQKAYKNTSSYGNIKTSTNEIYKTNKITIWEQIKSVANGLGKNMQNTGLGIDNGVNYFRQQLERNTRNNVFNSAVNMNNDFLKEQLNKNVNEEKAKSILKENSKYFNNIKNEQNNYQNKLKEKINNNNVKIQENIDSIDNPILKKTAELAPSIGQMIPGFVPGVGAIYMAGSASGQYYEDAKQRGMNDDEAQKYSGIMGLMEGATEMIGIENLSKAGKGIKALVKETTKQGTKEITKNSLKSVLKNYGIGIADNIMQEAIIDPIQELTAQTIAGKDKAQWEGIGQKMLQDGINGGLVSAILGGANLGIQSCTGIVEKIHSNKKITGQEVQKAVKEAGQQLDTSKMMMDSVEQQVNKYKDYYTGKQLDSNTQDVLTQAQNIIDNNQNLQQNQFNSQKQQIIPVQDENTSESNMGENTTKIKGYHGTNENFDNFDLKYFGKHDQGDFGKAVYFSDNENTASKYGKNVKQQDIELNNPYVINTEEDYKQLWSQLAKKTDISKLDKTELKLLKDPYTSQEEKNFMLYDKLNSEEKANAIQKLGYDGVIDNTYGQIAVFNTDKINNIANNQETLYNNAKNTTIKDFNESAKKYNIDYKNEDLKEIKQMFDKRGINAYFDENIFRNNNDAFSVWKPTYDKQGNISGREVVFNPNAQDTNTRVQELAIHELGHDLDLNEVQNMILKDASRKENWESARKSLENAYKQAYENDNIQISDENFNKIVDEEATMNILQRELGSQEYVNRLVNQNQSVAKKIYNWVIDKLNKFTGGKNEKLFWTDIRNKFETAYNQEFSRNEDLTKFSIAGRKSLDNIRNDNYSYNRGINAYDTAQKLAKQNIDNEQIRQKTGWFQDKNGDWKYEFSDKDMSLKNIKIKSDKTYKLSDILEHDTLFTLYPQLKELKVQIKNMDKIGGNYNKNNKSITLSTNSTKNNKMVEGTLIHEIQHAIQDIEGHELGTTSKLSKKNYYESLGEIEADNTRTRFVNEKYNNMDMSNVAPESSKINPKHRLYDHYMDNRNTIDKIKDSMFKYFKRLGDSNEGYQETNQENIQQSNRLVDDGRNGRHVESENNSGSFNLQKNKQKQLDIIQKNNKMQDDYHTGIRNIKDIKTFEEAIQDNESFVYGDYSLEDAQRDLERQKVTVYSSKPISQGRFVSTSKNMAQDYAGKGKVYSKEVNINDVAWINGDEGQYANINQKYALPIKDWQQFVEDNYQKQGTGKSLKEYNLPTKENVKTKLNLSTKENINTQGKRINWNEIERPEGKIRKHYKSIIESSNTTKEAKAIAKELMGTDTYVPDSNQSQIKRADNFIEKYGVDKATDRLMTNLETDNFTYDSLLKRVGVDDIALGERLIQYYSKTGDAVQLQNVIQATAMAGTEAGRAVQVFSILNHQTPQGQATWIQRSVDKMNNELAKKKGGTITKDGEGNVKVINKLGKDITDKVDLFNLTPDMIEKVINSKDKQTMYENIDSVYEELGSQVPKSTIEKIDSWRYFSMLANPRTHIRNMVGNVAMGKMQRVKDKLAGGIEDIASTFNKDMERTKTLRLADEKTKNFAKNDVLNTDVQSMMELNENKYNPQSRLQNARKTFKSDVLENTLGRLFDWNNKALEAEDALGLKSAYKKSLTDYLTANKIDTDKITDAQLSKARTYAVQQAKEATFHQANSIASAINQFSRKNKLTKGATDAILPFVKTPLNVAKAGLEYNPTGLLKTITVDTVKLRKGNITVNKYIDNLSKGLSGTGIAVLGYALADAGILKASGGDDEKKENYDEALGKQSYSIQIAGKTYSLDWLAPAGIPLFTGAEAYSIKNAKNNEKGSISSDDDKKSNQLIQSLENWANGMAKSISPMSEMSMISGLTSALSSYSDDKLSAIGTNAVKSYVNQFFPTLLGQATKTADDYERSTTSTKTGLLPKAIDQTKLQVMSKVPGLRQKLPTKADIWGNEQKTESNIALRAVNNFINPATVKNIDTSKVDEELNSLYDKIGEATILPSTIDKTYTINGQIYRMTNDEYAKYKKEYGQTSYKLLNGLINSKDYNNLNEEQKQKTIENVYSYAKEKNKIDYASNKNEILKTSTLYDTLEELKQKGGEQSAYLGYIAKTKDITGEGASKQKIEILANSNYSDNTKEIIYKNTEGSKDKKIILVDKLGLPINEYLKYKTNTFENDKDSDGKTISGSKKQKVYNYLNSISDKNLSQDYKKIICKIEGINDYDNDIVNFVNNSKQLNYDERTEILKNIGFKINDDGKIQTKSMIPIYKYVK